MQGTSQKKTVRVDIKIQNRTTESSGENGQTRMVSIKETIKITRKSDGKRNKTELYLFQHVKARQAIQNQNKARQNRRVNLLLTLSIEKH